MPVMTKFREQGHNATYPMLFPCREALWSYAPRMDSLHATIEEFAAEGYTHIECHCPRCRAIRPAQLSAWLPCAECGGQLHSVKPWRLENVLGKRIMVGKGVQFDDQRWEGIDA